MSSAPVFFKPRFPLPPPPAQIHLRSFLSYPLEETASSEAAKPFVEDNIKEVVEAIVAAADSGELATAVKGGHDTFKVGSRTPTRT